jgi:hypothetical protein
MMNLRVHLEEVVCTNSLSVCLWMEISSLWQKAADAWAVTIN